MKDSLNKIKALINIKRWIYIIYVKYCNIYPFKKFPLNLLLTARGSKVFVEIKSGDTFNGMIELVDKFMNVKLLNVIHTSKVNLYHNYRMVNNLFNSMKCI